LGIHQFRDVEKTRYKDLLKTVGNNVRNVRISKGFTMEAAANEANMEYRQLSRIERGEVNTTITSLAKIADALKVNITDFF
jgi:transcriptional regulator with XRE-family HTH domain